MMETEIALDCEMCRGTGLWPAPKPGAEFKVEQVFSGDRCPSCGGVGKRRTLSDHIGQVLDALKGNGT